MTQPATQAEPKQKTSRPIGAYLLGTLLSIVVLALVSILFWGSNKGFNITDEGSYLLSYQHPENYPLSLSAMPYVLHKLYLLFNGDIVWLRLSRIALLFTGALFYAFSFISFLANWRSEFHLPEQLLQRRFKIITLLFLLFGGLSACLLGPQTISYNHATQFLLLLFTGLIFRIHSDQQPSSSTLNYLWFAGLGGIIGCLFLVKWPVSMLVFLISVLTIAIERVRQHLSLLKMIGNLFAGIIAALGVYFLLFQSLPAWLAGLHLTLNAPQSELYSAKTLLANYIAQFIELIQYPFQHFSGELISITATALIFSYVLNRFPMSRLAAWGIKLLYVLILAIICLLLNAELLHLNGLGNIRTGMHVFLFIPILLGLWAVSAFAIFKPDTASLTKQARLIFVWITVLLFSLPFVGLFGTANPIGYNAYYGLVFWFTMTLLLSGFIIARRNSIAIPILSILLSIHFVLGQIAPYFLDGSHYLYADTLPTQNQPLSDFTGLKNLMVDAETLDFYQSTRKILTDSGFKPGDPILAFYDMPGLVYVLQGESPGIIWYNRHDENVTQNCFGLKLAGTEKLRHAYIILNSKLSNAMQSCLAQEGMKLDETNPMAGFVPFALARYYNPGFYNDRVKIYKNQKTTLQVQRDLTY